MNEIEQKILDKASTYSLDKLTLREIGEAVSSKPLHPQTVKYYLEKLQQKGRLAVDFKNKIIRRVNTGQVDNSNLIALPILGAANAGPAAIYADEYINGFLKLSPKMLEAQALINKDNIFVIEVSGNSMDRAKIGEDGLSAEDGDHIIVDGSNRNPRNGQYVLSVVDGMANIKKFVHEKNRISLLSESSENHPPIYIHPEDKYDYMINGVVLQVIKQ